MADLIVFLLGLPLILWAFHRVFVWPFTRKRK